MFKMLVTNGIQRNASTLQIRQTNENILKNLYLLLTSCATIVYILLLSLSNKNMLIHVLIAKFLQNHEKITA